MEVTGQWRKFNLQSQKCFFPFDRFSLEDSIWKNHGQSLRDPFMKKKQQEWHEGWRVHTASSILGFRIPPAMSEYYRNPSDHHHNISPPLSYPLCDECSFLDLTGGILSVRLSFDVCGFLLHCRMERITSLKLWFIERDSLTFAASYPQLLFAPLI